MTEYADFFIIYKQQMLDYTVVAPEGRVPRSIAADNLASALDLARAWAEEQVFFNPRIIYWRWQVGPPRGFWPWCQIPLGHSWVWSDRRMTPDEIYFDSQGQIPDLSGVAERMDVILADL